MIIFFYFKNTTRKRTSKAPENTCKTCIFISENAFYICTTYDNLVKNADVTKLCHFKAHINGF